MTWGFPCQDISISGKKKGVIEGVTRSGLYFEGLKVLKHKKPKYSIIENVDNLVKPSFKDTFNTILQDIEKEGYNNYYKVLNSLDFGIPQNRKRIFIISIRKDIDDKTFKFPEELHRATSLQDILEETVDERYIVKKHLNERFTKNYLQYDNSGKGYNSQAARAYYADGFMCTLPKCNGGDKTQILISRNPSIIRRATPLECWRLMGFDDIDYKKAKSTGQTMGSLYNQAGNSIVVNVIEYIFKNLFSEYIINN